MIGVLLKGTADETDTEKDVVDQGQRIQLVLPHVLRATVLGAGMSALMALLEEERTSCAGRATRMTPSGARRERATQRASSPWAGGACLSTASRQEQVG